uniref:calcium-binding protein n=1 Tax=uncultured Tateyamaria sp. TaxID=455651 RepID=UPI0026206838
ILAGDGDDAIYDGAGDDTVEGGAGRDRLYAGDGADSYDGGAGVDEVYYTRSTSGLTIDMTDSTNSTGIAAGDTFANIEYVRGSDFDDVIIADAQRVFGNGGDDILQDGAGFQFLLGGAGADTFRFIAGDVTRDRVQDFELGQDRLDFSAWGATQLSELSINEPVSGSGTPQGRLLIEYGAEGIWLDGLGSNDIAELTSDHFMFATPPVVDPDGGQIVDGTSSNDNINANFVDADGNFISDQGQSILAGDGDDAIYDGAGDDTVEGGAGRDRLYAGDGADSYDGGAGVDEVYYTRSTSGLTIDMTDSTNSTGIAAGDTFANIEYVRGSDFDDVIIADAQRVFGNGGDDILQDGAGFQFLLGGAGADTFRFIAGDGTRDRVQDFELGQDRLDFSAWGATQLSELSINEPVSGSGTPQGRLLIEYGAEGIWLDGLGSDDIQNLGADDFIFA